MISDSVVNRRTCFAGGWILVALVLVVSHGTQHVGACGTTEHYNSSAPSKAPCFRTPLGYKGHCAHSEAGDLIVRSFSVTANSTFNLYVLDANNFNRLRLGLRFLPLLAEYNVTNGTLTSGEKDLCEREVYLVVQNNGIGNLKVETFSFSTTCTSCWFPYGRMTKAWAILIFGLIGLLGVIVGIGYVTYRHWEMNIIAQERMRLLYS